MRQPARPLSRRERETLEALLAVDFPGVDALRAQLLGTRVTGRCACGCPTVDLEPPADAPPAVVGTSVPVEAKAHSRSGEGEGLVLLFVDDGRLSCLEYAPLGDRTPSTFPPVHRLVDIAPALDQPGSDE